MSAKEGYLFKSRRDGRVVRVVGFCTKPRCGPVPWNESYVAMRNVRTNRLSYVKTSELGERFEPYGGDMPRDTESAPRAESEET